MDKVTIAGIILTPLKQIFHPKGDVLHAMKCSDNGFIGFGEAYFSTIHFEEIKVWKKHLSMTLNFIVPVGEIRFVIYDDREDSSTYRNFFDVIVSQKNYQRLTVPPGVWVAFAGIGTKLNLLLNIADIEHDPEEIERKESLDEIQYTW
jgi:dTDP-4-dehydrorhamnose 3,5-epimerase